MCVGQRALEKKRGDDVKQERAKEIHRTHPEEKGRKKTFTPERNGFRSRFQQWSQSHGTEK